MAEGQEPVVEQPATASPEPAEESAVVVTEESIREKIRDGSVKSEAELEELLRQVPDDEPVEEPKEEEASQETPPEPSAESQDAPPEPAQPSVFDKPSKEWNSKEVVTAAKERGFNYENPYDMVESMTHREEALKTYKKEAREHRQLLEAEQARYKTLETELADIKKKMENAPKETPKAPEPTPVKYPDAPELPDFASLDYEEKEKAMVDYSAKVKEYYEDSLKVVAKSTDQETQKLKTEFSQKMNEMKSIVDNIQTETQKQKDLEESNKALERKKKVTEDAYDAANVFIGKNKEYSLGKKIKEVGNDWSETLKDLQYIRNVDPSLQIKYADKQTREGLVINGAQNMLRDYLRGDQAVAQALSSRNFNVSNDVKTFQLLVDLEADARSHNDYDEMGRPDFEMALLRQKKLGGLHKQDLINERMKGYDDAQKIANKVDPANNQAIPSNEGGTPPPKKEQITPERLAEMSREITELKAKNPQKGAEELAKFEVILREQGFLEKPKK